MTSHNQSRIRQLFAVGLIVATAYFAGATLAQDVPTYSPQIAGAMTQAWHDYQSTLNALEALSSTEGAHIEPNATPGQAEIIPITAIVYAQGTVNVRSCARRSCLALGTLSAGQGVPVNAYTNGEAVKAGNTVWYRFGFDGRDGFVYSEFVSQQPPTVPPAAPAQPVVFQGNSAQVIGPLTFTPGLYRARVTTTGFFIAQLQIVSGSCGAGTFYLSPIIFNLFEGDGQPSAEVVLRSEGCTTYIEMSNISAGWRLDITPIG